jgi:translation initiation factor 4G
MLGSFNKKPSNLTQGGGQSSRVNLPSGVNSSDSGNNAASTIRNVQNGVLTQHQSHGMFDDFYLLVGKELRFWWKEWDN